MKHKIKFYLTAILKRNPAYLFGGVPWPLKIVIAPFVLIFILIDIIMLPWYLWSYGRQEKRVKDMADQDIDDYKIWRNNL